MQSTVRARVLTASKLSLVFVGLMAGCSADGPASPNVGDPEAMSRWQPLLGDVGTSVGPLAFGQNAIIFNASEGDLVRGHKIFIKALGVDGLKLADPLEARAIVEDWAWDLWAEGDTLFYNAGADEKLFSVPIAGGAPTLVLDGGQPDLGRSFLHLLDADYFYFSYEMAGIISFGRMPRAGGPATKLGEYPGVKQIALATDGLVVAGTSGSGEVIPFDGGPPRALAGGPRPGPELFGVDAAGAYWSEYKTNSPTERPTILRAPVSGGPLEPFWTTKPALVHPIHIWPDLQRGWVVTAIEPLDDGVDHLEVWLLDADQNGRLAALDPGSHPGWSYAQPALSPDAVYLLVNYGDLVTWAMVRVPR